LWLLERAAREDGTSWTSTRWRHELAVCGLHVEELRAIRPYRPSAVMRAVEAQRLPSRLLDRAAALDLALTRARGVRSPYTECLMRAVRL
jgi:hypothetical protein